MPSIPEGMSLYEALEIAEAVKAQNTLNAFKEKIADDERRGIVSVETIYWILDHPGAPVGRPSNKQERLQEFANELPDACEEVKAVPRRSRCFEQSALRLRNGH